MPLYRDLLMRTRSPFDDIPGFAGGTLGDQLRRFRRSPLEEDDDLRVMSKPLGNGVYVERVIGPRGESVGFGDERDYEPLAGSVPVITRGPSLEEMPTAPTMFFGRNRKPVRAIGEDPLAADMELLRAQESYKAPRSTKDTILQGIFGFLGGGLPGAAANVLRYQLDEPYRRSVAIGDEIQNTKERIQQGLITRKSENDWLNDQSERDYRAAQTYRLRHPIEKDEGFTLGDTRYDSKGNVIVRNPKAVEPEGPVFRNVGNDLIRLTDGKPELIYRAPREDTASFTNSQIDQNIAEAQAELQRMGQSPPTQIDVMKRDPWTGEEVITKETNPAYTEWANRYRKLTDDIRQWRAQKKPTRSETRGPQMTRPAPRVSEQQIRDAAKAKGLDPEQAVRRARSRGLL